MNRLAPACCLLAALTVVSASAEPADRAELLAEFDAVKAGGDSPQDGPAIGLKVWVRAVGAGNLPTGPSVNPANRTWAPGEGFFLCVEAARPVHLYLFSIAAAGQPVCFSPDDNHPGSKEPAKPGRVWVSPRIVLDENMTTETLSIFAVDQARCLQAGGLDQQVAGAPTTIDVNVLVEVLGGGPGRAEATAEVRTRGAEESAEEESAAEELLEPSLDMAGVSRALYSKTKSLGGSDLPEGAKAIYGKTKMAFAAEAEKAASDNADEVCAVAVGNFPVGHVRFVFEKQADEPAE